MKLVYTVDPNHTTIGLSARHMMVTRVRGKFKEWSGQVEVEDNNPLTSVATLTINAASIDTVLGATGRARVADIRRGHVRGATPQRRSVKLSTIEHAAPSIESGRPVGEEADRLDDMVAVVADPGDREQAA